MDNYKENAEQNLIEMRNQEEKANKKLMKAESFLTILSVVASLYMIIAGSLIAELNPIMGIILCSALGYFKKISEI